MSADAAGWVALLIDFENLVRAVDEEDVDCAAVLRRADENGRILLANACADWRGEGREPVPDGPLRGWEPNWSTCWGITGRCRTSTSR